MAGKQSVDVQRKIIRSDNLLIAVIILAFACIIAFYLLIEPKQVQLQAFASPLSDENYSFDYSVPEINLTENTKPVVHKRKKHKRCHAPKVNKCQRVSNFIGPR